MRHKTYIPPDEQWDRTVRLYADSGRIAMYARSGLGNGVFLGRIVEPHRLFLPGDIAVVERTHGGCQRYQVFAVTGKGYRVRGMFLKFQADKYNRSALVRRRIKGVKSKRKLNDVLPKFCETFDSGPLRLVEHPDNLEDCFPDSPAVRQFVVETLTREVCRTSGKRG